MTNSFTAYMCKTDFDYDARGADDGARVYPSEEDLRQHRTCVHQCGIVKVIITLEKVIQEENWSYVYDDNPSFPVINND